MKRVTVPFHNRKGRPSVHVPNPIDVYLGNRIKEQRVTLGYSQKDLGEKMRLSYQQIQKYEMGINRIAVSRLIDFSGALNVPVLTLLEDMPLEACRLAEEHEGKRPLSSACLANKETLEVAEAYTRIRNYRLRYCISEITKAIANDRQNEAEVSET